ncbi:MAG: methyltransferase domain-containing protein [Dehalococcoidia bacterium]
MTDAQSSAPANRYAFEHAGEPASDRFDALAALYDETTTRHLKARGVGPGWRCLDVGAGGGSIARWLSEEVGPTGYVLATDLNTDYLERLQGGNLDVQRHNIVDDRLPEAAFDLAHTRLVLVHLPDREAVLQRLIAALKPGGWLVLEEFDARSMLPDASVNPAETGTPLVLAIQQVLTNHGADTRCGRLLPGRLRANGMQDVDAEGRVLLWQGGSVGAGMQRTNARHMRAEIIDSGLMTADEFERELARLDDPSFMAPSPIMWTVWGRRPA